MHPALVANASKSRTLSILPAVQRSAQTGHIFSGTPSEITTKLPHASLVSAIERDARISGSPATAKNDLQSLSVMGPAHPLNDLFPLLHEAIAANPGAKIRTNRALVANGRGFMHAAATVYADHAALIVPPARSHASHRWIRPGVNSECISVTNVPPGPGSGYSIPHPRFSESTTGCSSRILANVAKIARFTLGVSTA